MIPTFTKSYQVINVNKLTVHIDLLNPNKKQQKQQNLQALTYVIKYGVGIDAWDNSLVGVNAGGC